MQTNTRPSRYTSGFRLMVAAGTLALLVAGCSEAEKAFNSGGDTTCGDYLQMDNHKQRVTITKMLQQRAGNNDDPPGTSVDLSMAAVGGLCSIPGRASVPIKDAAVVAPTAPAR